MEERADLAAPAATSAVEMRTTADVMPPPHAPGSGRAQWMFHWTMSCGAETVWRVPPSKTYECRYHSRPA